MKQTAVEWLIEELDKIYRIKEKFLPSDWEFLEEMSKAMERQQMLNAFEESRLTHPMIGFKHETFKEYYNETFKTNEK
jgi:hypothetical protein